MSSYVKEYMYPIKGPCFDEKFNPFVTLNPINRNKLVLLNTTREKNISLQSWFGGRRM